MRKEVELSARLKALADMVTPGNRVCDVGCDHGFLSIYLVQKGISPGVIAMDVRSGPLSRCVEHVALYGLDEYIETRLSDGLTALKAKEADTMICAGMGGRLMQKILTEGRDIACGLKELILQPQSEVKAFREFLRSQGYQTVEENMIEEEGKYYPMMKVIPVKGRKAVSSADSLYDRYGRFLLTEQNMVLYDFLIYRSKMLKNIRNSILSEKREEKTSNTKERLAEIETELQDIERAFAFYNGRCGQ